MMTRITIAKGDGIGRYAIRRNKVFLKVAL